MKSIKQLILLIGTHSQGLASGHTGVPSRNPSLGGGWYACHFI